MVYLYVILGVFQLAQISEAPTLRRNETEKAKNELQSYVNDATKKISKIAQVIDYFTKA